MPPDLAILALDDGVLLNGNSYSFESIEDAAESYLHSLSLILREMKSYSPLSIVLAGWSYGGVIAVQMAKIFDSLHLNGSVVTLKGVIMFDSPLRTPAHLSHDENESIDFLDVNSDSSVVSRLARDHFLACTRLLETFHHRPAEQQPLCIPLFDFRPSSFVRTENSFLTELTTGSVECIEVPGNHWTMLFGNNANIVAQLVTQIINRL